MGRRLCSDVSLTHLGDGKEFKVKKWLYAAGLGVAMLFPPMCRLLKKLL